MVQLVLSAQGWTNMPRKIMDDEMEPQSQIGQTPIFAVAVCLTLSALCGLLWVFLLLWPQLLTVFR
jgi:hypothetical protein